MPRLRLLALAVLCLPALWTVAGCGADDDAAAPAPDGRTGVPPPPAVVDPSPPLGRWTVWDYKDPSGAADGASWLGETADIRAGGITFRGDSCAVADYRREIVPAAAYLQEHYGIEPGAVDVPPEQFSVVHTGCDLPGLDPLLQLSDAQLFVEREGLFLFFNRTPREK